MAVLVDSNVLIFSVQQRIHGIDRILTYNPSDFRRYEGIAVIQPSDVP